MTEEASLVLKGVKQRGGTNQVLYNKAMQTDGAARRR